ncbi:MAG: tetratricopeptide repeat protein [Christensenellaceae bacterium]
MISFDQSEEFLLSLGDSRRLEGDLYGALRLYRRAQAQYNKAQNDLEYLSLYADVYELSGIVDSALTCWFCYLDRVLQDEVPMRDDLVEAYEALVVCYDRKGMPNVSNYYYEKLTKIPGWSNDELGDYLADRKEETEESEERSPFNVVWPPQLADYGDVVARGLELMRRGNFADAKKELEDIPPKSKEYPQAMNLTAICCLMLGKEKKALEAALAGFGQDQNNVELLITLSTAYKAAGQREKGVEIAKKLMLRRDLETEERFKIAALLCELDLHAEAYDYCRALEAQMPYDGNLLYIEGAAAARSGNYEAAISVLDRLVLFYPDAAVARYYAQAFREGKTPEISYVYRVPEEVRKERETYLNFLFSFQEEEPSALYESSRATIDEYLLWCFDEMDGQDYRLQALAISFAFACGAEELLGRLLIDPQIDDVIKVEVARELCLKNYGANYPIVAFGVYQRAAFPKLHLGQKARKKFLEAYAECFVRFGLRSEQIAKLLPSKTEELYHTLKRKEKLGVVKDGKSIAAVIAFLSARNQRKEDLAVITMIMGGDAGEVKGILEAYYEEG